MNVKRAPKRPDMSPKESDIAASHPNPPERVKVAPVCPSEKGEQQCVLLNNEGLLPLGGTGCAKRNADVSQF
jgi:hypothetical protein